MTADPRLAGARDDQQFRVLMVCTANICRSPLAEHLMRRALEQRFGPDGASRWTVRSAGTHAIVGAPIHEHAATVLAERGIVVPPTAARLLVPAMVERADLILTASRAQRSIVVQAVPAAVRRVFTLRQFARLCAAAPSTADVSTGPSGLLDRAAAGRARVQPVDERAEVIADPMGQPVDAFRAVAELTARSIDDILRSLDTVR